MNTLEDMALRAQRQLDGMAVNRDRMAMDVLDLVALVRTLQQRLHRFEDHYGQDEPPAGTLDEAVGDIFDGIFKQ